MRTGVIFALVAVIAGCGHSTPAPKPSVTMTGACYVCMKPINGDGGVLATLPSGFERCYRCIHCALTDLAPYTGLICTRSLVSNREIRITLSHAGWTVTPPEAVFLVLRETRGDCFAVHQSFAHEDEFLAYLADHPRLQARSPRPLRLAEYRELIRMGKEG